MALSTYNQKRSFNQTPEPGGKKTKTTGELRFVIQKHDASHLHYDFRLEMEGVLKSWAVPKGPSTDPEIKRLAMMVEDHPYAYRTFEGIIPEGNYGAGTVIVWDEGTYEPTDAEGLSKKEKEKKLLAELKTGKLKFTLKGKKLKGTFALVKASGRGDNGWLLMKVKDRYAAISDITKKSKSVQSGKTLEQIEKTSTTVWKSNRSQKMAKEKVSGLKKEKKEKTKTPSGAKKKRTVSFKKNDVNDLLEKGKRKAFPAFFQPMLATLTDKPFSDPEWIYEIKWDGYRAVSFIRKENVKIISRNNLSFTEKFTTVTNALKNFGINAVIDGEIVALDNKGIPSFQELQNFAKNGKEATLIYQVFDLIWYEGKDYSFLPLAERKEILKNILPENDPVIKYSDHVGEKGKEFFDAAIQKGLEGIMAKKRDSTYAIGFRSKNWLKIKNNQRTEAIICGFTKARNSRDYFGAIILGKYNGDKLEYIGHSGSGFTQTSLEDLYKKMRPLIRTKSPFSPVPKTNMPATWIKPELVCEIKFAEWTKEGVMRQPIFIGLREDKKASDEKNEKIVPVPTQRKKITASPVKNKTNTPDEKQRSVRIQNHPLTFTNLNKIYWPKEKITKGQVIDYYDRMTEYILPYLKGRPQSLNRHPDGIAQPGFYQKDVSGKVADWIQRYKYKSESGEDKEYMVCDGKASLLYMANLGCIEMNPWHSTVKKPDYPDWCVIDLDPDTNKFSEVIEIANLAHEILESFRIPSYPKTSGSTGIHIYIPLGRKYTYDQSKLFAELLAEMILKESPKNTSILRMPVKRKGKIYLDFLQNRTIQTIAAPYSLRPKPGAPVSMPLDWSELKPGLKILDFTIFNAEARVRETGDLFAAVLGKGIQLDKILTEIQREISPALD